jgi:hypothetical protein
MRSALLALAATLVLAAPAAAVPVTPTVTTLSPPAAMPISFLGASSYGFTATAGQPIPAGMVVLGVDFETVAGQAAEMVVSCPTGLGVVDLEVAGAPVPGGLDGPIGENQATLLWRPTTSGPAHVYVLCGPIAANVTSTRLTPRRSPIRFPGRIAGLAKGAKLPAGASILRVRLTGLPNGVLAVTQAACPRRRLGLSIATDPRGVRVVPLSTALVIAPPTGLAPGQTVTVYQLCGRIPKNV